MDFDPIITPRFELVPLRVDHVGERYRTWFADPVVRRFILSASNGAPSLQELRQFVSERETDPSVLFLGIWVRESKALIGTLKFEPVDVASGFAVCGILIGESGWRGQGVAGEVLRASIDALARAKGITRFGMGVDPCNTAALSAYRKLGFRQTDTQIASKADHLSFLLELGAGGRVA